MLPGPLNHWRIRFQDLGNEPDGRQVAALSLLRREHPPKILGLTDEVVEAVVSGALSGMHARPFPRELCFERLPGQVVAQQRGVGTDGLRLAGVQPQLLLAEPDEIPAELPA